MTAKAHAILSASSSDRWLHCPPSARLCEAYEDKGSDYAAEGTDAHALGEYKLKPALGLPSEDPTDSLTVVFRGDGGLHQRLCRIRAGAGRSSQGNLYRSGSSYRAACGLLPLGRTWLRYRRLHHHRGRHAPGDRLQARLRRSGLRRGKSADAMLRPRCSGAFR